MPRRGVELALNSLPPGRKPLIKSEMAKRWAVLQGNLKASPLFTTLEASTLLVGRPPHPIQKLVKMKPKGMYSLGKLGGRNILNQWQPE